MWKSGTPVCRLCGRYLVIPGRPIRIRVPAVTRPPTALVGSLIRSSNLPHSLQRGVHVYVYVNSLSEKNSSKMASKGEETNPILCFRHTFAAVTKGPRTRSITSNHQTNHPARGISHDGSCSSNDHRTTKIHRECGL